MRSRPSSPAAMAAVFAATLLAALLLSCETVPKEIPDSLSAPEIIQRAQEASDGYHYKAALAYYRALKDRYSADPLYRTTAEYEIAFIAYKEERYADAEAGFNALLAEYAGPDGQTLPPGFKILSEKVLGEIKARKEGAAQ